MNTAVHFGAGNIGRGFLGQLYFESGFSTVFVDVDQALVDSLRAHGGYTIEVVGERTERIPIANVSAIHGGDREAVAEALAAARIASTAAGVRALPHIAPLLAAGIERRFADSAAAPLDIIVCENLLNAGSYLRERVREHLPPVFHRTLDARVGFVEASVGRMVPMLTAAQRAEDPLRVCVEPYCQLPVDAEAFRGPIPAMAHLEPRARFAAYVERKLFVHNMSHAATAYLGHLRGYEFIWEAIQDPRVRALVSQAIDESSAGLHAKHGLAPDELAAHRDDLLHRYTNRALADSVARVAADPLRKLGPDDRLIGALRLCAGHDLPTEAIALAAAAAIRYDIANDPGAATLRQIYDAQGLEGVLSEVCRIDLAGAAGRRIAEASARLTREGWLEC